MKGAMTATRLAETIRSGSLSFVEDAFAFDLITQKW
jgi:hypothetical protein